MSVGDSDAPANETEVSLIRSLGSIVEASPEGPITGEHLELLRGQLRQWFEEMGHKTQLRRNHGRGVSSKVGFSEEARWLIETARQQSPDTAVARLREFVDRNEESFSEVLLFWGMHPPDSIQVAQGIVLGPLEASPPSAARSKFLGESVGEDEKKTTEYATQYPKPRAVLARDVLVTPIYEEAQASPQPFTWDDKYFMSELLQVLPLVIRSPVIRVAQFQQWPADTPVVSEGYAWSLHARITKELPMSPYEEPLVKRLIGDFLALGQPDRNRLRLPLRRLNSALLSESLSDRAIELGVALEALLTQEGDPTDGLTHRVALRTALLIESGLDARRAIKEKVKTLYELRSKAAHGVDLDEIERERQPSGLPKKFKDGQAINMVLEDGRDLICEVVNKVLELGGFPDYNDLELDPP